MPITLALAGVWFAMSSQDLAKGSRQPPDSHAPSVVLRPSQAQERPSTRKAGPTTPTLRLGAKAYFLDGYPDIPDGAARAMIDQLDDAAREGDSHAALLIHLKIDQCFRALTDQNDPDALVLNAEVLGSLDAALEAQRMRISQCEGLTRQDYASRGEWLSMAAELGNPFAQLIYSSMPEVVLGPLAEILRQPERLVEFKRRAVAQLHFAVSGGNVNALERLSQIYSDGYLAPADPVAAQSYRLAAMQADPGTERREVEEANKTLDPMQRAEAARMAKEIYRECCEIK